jgi:hypothetical protein
MKIMNLNNAIKISKYQVIILVIQLIQITNFTTIIFKTVPDINKLLNNSEVLI